MSYIYPRYRVSHGILRYIVLIYPFWGAQNSGRSRRFRTDRDESELFLKLIKDLYDRETLLVKKA